MGFQSKLVRLVLHAFLTFELPDLGVEEMVTGRLFYGLLKVSHRFLGITTVSFSRLVRNLETNTDER